MSTEIKSVITARTIRIDGPGRVPGGGLVEQDKVQVAQVLIPRADFLKAVADELDVIVIEKANLPGEPLAEWERELLDADTDSKRRVWARLLDAAREWVEASERDAAVEAQVEAWARILIDVEMDHSDGPTPHTVARRLVEKGISAPEVTP